MIYDIFLTIQDKFFIREIRKTFNLSVNCMISIAIKFADDRNFDLETALEESNSVKIEENDIFIGHSTDINLNNLDYKTICNIVDEKISIEEGIQAVLYLFYKHIDEVDKENVNDYAELYNMTLSLE